MSFKPIYKLRPWFLNQPINLSDSFYEELLNNERCCDVLEKYSMVNIKDLSRHPGAIHLIESNLHLVDMCELAGNTGAGHLLNKVFKTAIEELESNYFANNCITTIYNIAENPSAMHIIKQMFYQIHTSLHKNIINWKINREFVKRLCYNENAVELLEQLPPEIINFESLAENENAVHLMEKWIDHWKNIPCIWSQLCFNKKAIRLIKKYPLYINWFSLVQNESDEAVDILLENQQNIELYLLSQNNNPRAYELYKKLVNLNNDNEANKDSFLANNNIRKSDIWIAKNTCAMNDIETKLKLCKDNQDYRNYIMELIQQGLLQNPELYILDYEAMKKKINYPLVNDLSFVEELLQVTLKPKRLRRYMKEYNYDILSDEYME